MLDPNRRTLTCLPQQLRYLICFSLLPIMCSTRSWTYECQSSASLENHLKSVPTWRNFHFPSTLSWGMRRHFPPHLGMHFASGLSLSPTCNVWRELPIVAVALWFHTAFNIGPGLFCLIVHPARYKHCSSSLFYGCSLAERVIERKLFDCWTIHDKRLTFSGWASSVACSSAR